MTLLKKTAFIIALVAIAAGVVRHFFPRVETKTVEVEKEVVRTDVRTVIRTVEVPGKKETITTIIDNTVATSDRTSTRIVYEKSKYIFGLGAGYNLEEKSVQYGVKGAKRIGGPFFIEAEAQILSTGKISGGMLYLSMEF